MTNRKLRSDSFAAALTEEQRAVVYDAMKVSPWQEVAALCEEKFGIRPGKTALYEFTRAMRETESEKRIADALAFQAATRRAVEQIGDMDDDMAAGWEQLALEASLSGNVELAERYLNLAETLRARALEHAKLNLKQAAESRALESLELAKTQFREKMRGDLERGLQALYEQVATNPHAVTLVRQLQTLLTSGGGHD